MLSVIFRLRYSQTRLSSASRIDTLQVTVNGADGNGGLSGSIETLQEVVGDENDGLSSQYSVKLDNNGYIAGFRSIHIQTMTERLHLHLL